MYPIFRLSICLLFVLLSGVAEGFNPPDVRKDILLDRGWKTVLEKQSSGISSGIETASFNDKTWQSVEVPHNWDDYGNYTTNKHANRHGTAWYRRTFSLSSKNKGRRLFLWFEGVSSYATVWVNGRKAGSHAGGRTSFTLDVTDLINFNKPNLLTVKAEHPAGITNLPWVCGGCHNIQGFSEGSQPMGIFRPVHLIVTAPVRIEPFGIHVWNNNDVTEQSAVLHAETEIKNYGSKAQKVTLSSRLVDKNGKTIALVKRDEMIPAQKRVKIKQLTPLIQHPKLWSLENPYLYTVISEVIQNGEVTDRETTNFGIRKISWPIGPNARGKQFLLNEKPVFINGTCEYEHLMGQGHAFSEQQIHTRVMQITAGGFNAFRDAHQPHNLRYQDYWEKLGLLWWPQFGSHIWFDNPEFRSNFKILLTEWVKERRNNPALVLWGLMNESVLPADFARECTELIRELDPTSSSQRKVTTCNGGEGTDWDVPQNWTGTYGGDPATYAEDIQRQQLIGEYGAWRSLDLHTEGPFNQNGVFSEDRMTQLMEMKVRLAESVRDKVCGHFNWLLNSHDNPGRVQNGEGFRNLDRIGPVNYKGLFTAWGEPTDAYYMYRGNYASKEKEPMVYIVSHTWPNRWLSPGIKDSISIYSNCDEVELFNDMGTVSLGKRTRNGIGTHFQWDKVNIQYNVLYAEGRVNGKVVARDYIVLNHLPQAPNLKNLVTGTNVNTQASKGYNYLYRVNCGGPDYTDAYQNKWQADVAGGGENTWTSRSWAEDYPGLPVAFGSQRRTFDPIKGTSEQGLFQTFRYGRHKLNYIFPVPDGDYLIELYFVEPWYGIGGGMDCQGWRLFDVAVNGSTVLQDVDIWKEAGTNSALKKVVKARVKGGRLEISFPRVNSGQALISAIAIATLNPDVKPAAAAPSLIKDLAVSGGTAELRSWLDLGQQQYIGGSVTFSELPQELYGAEWIKTGFNTANPLKAGDLMTFGLRAPADVYVALDERITEVPGWLKGWTATQLILKNDHKGGHTFRLYRKHFSAGVPVKLGQNGTGKLNDADPYTVIVHQRTILEQQTDNARPITAYEAEKAKLSGLEVTQFFPAYSGEGYAAFPAQAGAVLEWTIAVGVGDTYSLNFKYINNTGKDIPVRMQILAADGSIMRDTELNFLATSGQWVKLESSTGTSINAGTYRVRLTAPASAKGLGIDVLEVR